MVQETATMRNGVNVDQLFGTLDAVKEQPELGEFTWKARNTWINGPHNRTTIQTFYGASGDQEREAPFEVDAGEPAILVGSDEGPNPAEFILHAIAACLTTSLVYVASARSVNLNAVTSEVEGDMDVRGALGLSDEVRNGYSEIRVRFDIDAEASDEEIQKLLDRAASRSAVFDTLMQGVTVKVSRS
jgi:uncharacterized OsmC-like protein